MAWKVTSFRNIKFKGLSGQHILKALNAKINIKEDFLEINNNKINFINTKISTHLLPYILKKNQCSIEMI